MLTAIVLMSYVIQVIHLFSDATEGGLVVEGENLGAEGQNGMEIKSLVCCLDTFPLKTHSFSNWWET